MRSGADEAAGREGPDYRPPDASTADPAFHALRASAAARLAPHCRHLPRDAFEQLVTDVARFRQRWVSVPPT
jgi:hypothetical protein